MKEREKEKKIYTYKQNFRNKVNERMRHTNTENRKKTQSNAGG